MWYRNCNTVHILLVAAPYNWLLQFTTAGRPKKIGGRGICNIFSKMHKFILKYRLPISVNPTRISRMCMRKDVVKMYVKQHDRARCYTLFWGKNYDLSLLLTLQDENPKSRIRVYRKQYIRVSLNPCKPFAHALLGIMICSRWLLFLSNVHIC